MYYINVLNHAFWNRTQPYGHWAEKSSGKFASSGKNHKSFLIMMMMMMMIIIIIIIKIIITSKTKAIFVLYSMSFVFHFYSFIGFYLCCTEISSQFEIISNLPAVKSCAYPSALPGQNSKVLSSRSMEQRGEVPYAKRGEETILIRTFSVFAK